MRRDLARAAVLAAALAFLAPAARAGEQYGLGRPPTPAEIAAWNIDIGPDGTGLPSGSGSVAAGAAVFTQRCAACHGADGRTGDGLPVPPLVGGQGTLASAKPVKTVGSYWPYATTLFDYIRRAMPLDAPQTLSGDQIYAVSAYVLHLNGIVPADAVLDATSLAQVRMPNRDGFAPTPNQPGGSATVAH